MRELESQLSSLLRLLYESKNCHAEIDAEKNIVIFHGKNNGTVSRADGVHAAAMPQLAVALGNKFYAQQDAMSTGGLMPDQFEVKLGEDNSTLKNGHRLFSNFEEIRDALLTKELTTLLVSAQNYDFFCAHKSLHPLTGKGASNSKINCLTENLLDGYEIKAAVKEDGRPYLSIKNFDATDKSELVKKQIADALAIEENALAINRDGAIEIIFNFPLEELLARMEKRKVNYQGVIPIDANGSILIARRKNAFENFTLGYATAGGHCSDPYHPQLGALSELSSENGICLRASADLAALQLVKKTDDQALFLIREQDFELTKTARTTLESRSKSHLPFLAESSEFIAGTESALSIPQMREQKIPLRNIPSIDLYLQYCQERLEEILILKNINFTKVEIPVDTVVSASKRVKIPALDFGVIKIFCVDLQIKETVNELRKYLGDNAEIVTIGDCIQITNLNPEQVIDCLNNKTHDLQNFQRKFLQSQKENAAAIKIQDGYKNYLSRRDTAESTAKNLPAGDEIAIKEKSQINLRRVAKELREMHLLPPQDQEALALEGKTDSDIFSAAEEKLFNILLTKEYWLTHCGPKWLGNELEDSGYNSLLDPHEAARRRGTTYSAKRDIYDWSGIGRNIFWSIAQPINLSIKDLTIIRASFNDILRQPQIANSFWASDHFYSYKEKPVKAAQNLNGAQLKLTYKEQKKDGDNSQHIKEAIFTRTTQPQTIIEESKMGDNVVISTDIIPFMAYKFIQYLRFCGIESGIRKAVLAKCTTDIKYVEKVMGVFFNPYDFILHNPTKFRVNNPAIRTQIISGQELQEQARKINAAIESGDLAELKKLQELGYDFVGLPYKNYDETLPIITAIKAKKPEILMWLIEQNFYPELFINNEDPIFIGDHRDCELFYPGIAKEIYLNRTSDESDSTYESLVSKGLSLYDFYHNLSIIASQEMLAWYKKIAPTAFFFDAAYCIKQGINDLSALQYGLDILESEGKIVECSEEDILENIKRNRVEIARFLAEKFHIEPAVDVVKKFGEKMLSHKLKFLTQGELAFLRYVITEKKFDPNFIFIPETDFGLIDYAILNEDVDLVKILLEQNAQITDLTLINLIAIYKTRSNFDILNAVLEKTDDEQKRLFLFDSIIEFPNATQNSTLKTLLDQNVSLSKNEAPVENEDDFICWFCSDFAADFSYILKIATMLPALKNSLSSLTQEQFNQIFKIPATAIINKDIVLKKLENPLLFPAATFLHDRPLPNALSVKKLLQIAFKTKDPDRSLRLIDCLQFLSITTNDQAFEDSAIIDIFDNCTENELLYIPHFFNTLFLCKKEFKMSNDEIKRLLQNLTRISPQSKDFLFYILQETAAKLNGINQEDVREFLFNLNDIFLTSAFYVVKELHRYRLELSFKEILTISSRLSPENLKIFYFINNYNLKEIKSDTDLNAVFQEMKEIIGNHLVGKPTFFKDSSKLCQKLLLAPRYFLKDTFYDDLLSFLPADIDKSELKEYFARMTQAITKTGIFPQEYINAQVFVIRNRDLFRKNPDLLDNSDFIYFLGRFIPHDAVHLTTTLELDPENQDLKNSVLSSFEIEISNLSYDEKHKIKQYCESWDRLNYENRGIKKPLIFRKSAQQGSVIVSGRTYGLPNAIERNMIKNEGRNIHLTIKWGAQKEKEQSPTPQTSFSPETSEIVKAAASTENVHA